MGVVKHDLAKLKHEYLTGNYESVNAFLIQKGLKNKISGKSVKGWTKEKQALKQKATDRALKKVETKLANKLEPSTEFLLGNITKAIELSARKLVQMQEKDNINVKDLNTIWSMNRIQNNQPTTYVKSENENIEKIQGIHIVIGGNIGDGSQTSQNQTKSNE